MNTSTNTTIAIVVAIIAIIIGGIFLLNKGDDEQADETMNETEKAIEDAAFGEAEFGENTFGSSADSAPEDTTSSEPTSSSGETSDSGTADETTSNNPSPPAEEEPDNSDDGNTGETIPAPLTITYTDDGFGPSTITISAGDTVTFINGSSGLMWPASVIHPTHKVYPGSSIQKCGTTEEASIFDSCGRITSGDSWSFTFTEVGDWKYHNHLRISKTGTIVVE